MRNCLNVNVLVSTLFLSTLTATLADKDGDNTGLTAIEIPFGATAADLLNDARMVAILDGEPMSEEAILALNIRPSGHFGFQMTMIYLIRNLRVAFQHDAGTYSHTHSLILSVCT